MKLDITKKQILELSITLENQCIDCMAKGDANDCDECWAWKLRYAIDTAAFRIQTNYTERGGSHLSCWHMRNPKRHGHFVWTTPRCHITGVSERDCCPETCQDYITKYTCGFSALTDTCKECLRLRTVVSATCSKCIYEERGIQSGDYRDGKLYGCDMGHIRDPEKCPYAKRLLSAKAGGEE